MTEGTFDAYNWGLIENKQKFIGQLMSGKNPSRSCEDVDEAALSYAEVKALASGDPRIMEKTELDGQVRKLKLLKANHESQRYALEDKLLQFYPKAVRREEELIRDMEADLKHFQDHAAPDKEHFSMTVMGTVYTEKKEAGQAILSAFERLKSLNDKIELGEYCGFPMILWVSDSEFSQKLQITLKHNLSHTIEPGADAFGNITRLDNLLEGMAQNLENHRGELENLFQQMEEAKAEIGRPFPQEEELKEKAERLNHLNMELNIGGKERSRERNRTDKDEKTSIKRLLHHMGGRSFCQYAHSSKGKRSGGGNLVKPVSGRTIPLYFKVSPEEKAVIEKKMEQLGTHNQRAYLRKMNQIARRVNSTGNLYAEDIDDLKIKYGELWGAFSSLLSKFEI